MTSIKTALIVGGGIGGLTAAIALRRVGIDVAIFERAKAFREIGAGLWLWQNALNALDTLGIGDEIRSVGVQNAHGGIRSAQGSVLVQRMPSRPDAASVAILRSELQAALLRAVDPNNIRVDAECTDFTQDAERV